MSRPDDPPRRALFDFSAARHFFWEMRPVAEHFQREGTDVHVLVSLLAPHGEEAVAWCEAAGMQVHRPPRDLALEERPAPGADAEGPATRTTPLARASRTLSRMPLLRRAGSLLALVRRDLRIRAYTERLIERIRPDFVFAPPFQSCGQLDNGIRRACVRRRIPFFCLPVSAYLGERNSIDARFMNVRNGMLPASLRVDAGPLNCAIAAFLPHWTRARDGVRIFMWDPVAMLVARLTGLLEPEPWQKPSTAFDVVFVESEFSRDMLVASSYPGNKVVVSGKPRLDDVVRDLGDAGHAAAVYRSCGLADGTPFLLFNVEPSAEHGYSTWPDHWARFRALMDALRPAGIPVVLSLHPLCDPANYAFVEADDGFVISRQYSITELLPYASLVVSFPCSTNLLVPEFERPLIIYDFFGLTSEDSPRKDLFRIPGAQYAYAADELRARVTAAVAGGDLRPVSPEAFPCRKPASETIYRYVMDLARS